MKTRSLLVLTGAVASLTACDGLREALTAHVDVAARAENQELSVNRLSELLGNTTLQIPVNRETANILTELWTNYQLLGIAAARGDTLNDPKLIDQAALGITSNIRLRRFMESVAKSFKADSASETSYNQAAGGLFVARHILFKFPDNATDKQKDSVKKRAEAILPQVTAVNFAAMAKKYSQDPGSAQRGGSLGAFHQGDMVKQFSDGVAALKPGQVSGLIESPYGYHIILRPTYAEAKAEYDASFSQTATQRAESLYVAKLDSDMKITVKPNAATTAKGAARELAAHRSDDDAIASFKGGNLSVGRFVQWVESYPPGMRIPQQLAQAPDSLVRNFVLSVARNEVMLKKADSAGIKMSPEETQQLHNEFTNLVTSIWQQMGVDPKQLADSAKSAPERERLAASRVDTYLDRVMAGQAQPISVPVPVQMVATTKFKSKTYPAGIDRAVERATRLRASADSARAANQPKSQVPLPMPPADTTGRTKQPTKQP